MYGSQADGKAKHFNVTFEKDVNMYGSQAVFTRCGGVTGLRRM